MKITVYVPCHNNESTIGQVLASLRQQTRQADQFLFIDDRCTDQSPRIAGERDFQVLQMPMKQGLGAARNCALNHAEGELILGVDADVAVDANYIEEMEMRFCTMPQIAAIGGRMDERFTDTPADLWRAVHLCQHLGENEVVNPQIVAGCNMAGRVAALRAVGGWNESFTRNFEDIDLSARLKSAGHRLLYAPACHAWHLKRDTVDSVVRAMWNYNYYPGLERTDPNLSQLDKWSDQRLSFIWFSYRKFRMGDLDHPSLRMISLKAAWSWVIRDLHVLRQSAPEVGDIRQVVNVAEAVVTRCGMSSAATRNLTGWLTDLAVSLEQPGRSSLPLYHSLANMIFTRAMESIPDVHFWRDFPV